MRKIGSAAVAVKVNDDCAAVLAKASARSEKAVAVLDAKVRRVHEIRHGVQVSMWELGATLSDIHLREDWKARGTHANFTAFVRAEIDIPMPSVHKLIRMSQRFSAAQTRAFGSSRLFEIQAAPEGCWGELLKLCETGATVKQLRDRVREIKIAKGGRTAVMRQAHARGNTANAVVAAAAKRDEERATKTASARATVNLRAQEWSIALLARKSPGEKAAKPARSIAQQPSGSIVVEGAGMILFSLFEGDGGAICVDAKFTPEVRVS